MAPPKISNEMIYELLQAQGRRIDDHHDLMKDTREEMKEMRREQHHQGQRLRQVEDKIDGIRITWSSRLVAGILGTSAVTSAVVAYFITSIF